jgi:hypothetical protein
MKISLWYNQAFKNKNRNKTLKTILNMNGKVERGGKLSQKLIPLQLLQS